MQLLNYITDRHLTAAGGMFLSKTALSIMCP